MMQNNNLLGSNRTVTTRGIHNFRDFGQYPIAGGGYLIGGRLFRSGDHAQATPDDLTLMHDMGIRTFVDLRGTSERERAPCRRYDALGSRIICGDGETAEMAPHVEAAQTLEAGAARRTFQSRYRTLPFRPILIDVYRQYLQLLAESDEPSVIYCSAGKDRTGVLVALLQSLLGVHRDDVIGDYMLTNTGGDVEARIDALRKDLTKRFGPLSDEAIRVVTSVEPSFLEAAFDAISERHGSLDNYFSQVLEVTPQRREAISAKLIV